MLAKVNKMKELMQAKAKAMAEANNANRYNTAGEPDASGMEASIYNNLGDRPKQPSPMLNVLKQGPAQGPRPEIDDTPATMDELINLFVHPDFVPSNDPDVRKLQLDQDLSEDEAIMMLKRRMR